MGLLEKAQQNRTNTEKNSEGSNIVEEKEEHLKPSGLLEKAKQRRQKIVTEKTINEKEDKIVEKLKQGFACKVDIFS